MKFEKILQQGLIWRGFQFSAVIFLNIVLSRSLQAAGAGWVYFLTNFFSLAVLVGSLNIDSAFIFFLASKKGTVAALSWFGIAFTVLVSLILIPLYQLYFTYYPIHNVSLQISIEYGEYYAIGIVLANIFAGLFYAQKDFFISGFTLGILNYILSFYIIYAQRNHIATHTIIDAYFIFFTVQGVIITLLFFIKNKVLFSFQLLSYPQLQQLFRYSLISFIANFIYFLVCRIDFWFVEHYRNAAELGNYIQASKMGQMLLIVPQILASVILPQIAGDSNKKAAIKSILVISRLLIQLFIVIIILDICFGQFVFSAVFGSTFHLMNLPFLLLLPGILSLAILTLFSAYFGGKNRLIVDVIGASAALLFVVVCNSIFTNKYGIAAAAIISSIGYTINLGYCVYAFFKLETDYSMKDFFNWTISDYQLITKLLRKTKDVDE